MLPDVLTDSLLEVGSVTTYLALIVLRLQAPTAAPSLSAFADVDVAKMLGIRFAVSPVLATCSSASSGVPACS